MTTSTPEDQRRGAELEILDALLLEGPVVPILCAELVLPPVARAR